MAYIPPKLSINDIDLMQEYLNEARRCIICCEITRGNQKGGICDDCINILAEHKEEVRKYFLKLKNFKKVI